MAEDESEAPDGDRTDWFGQLADVLREKPAADVAREFPGLVDLVAADERRVDHYVVGVSFTKQLRGFDYAVDRVVQAADGDEPVVERVKAPASSSHRYVHFAHPPDPHFGAEALRARLLAAVDRERRDAAIPEEPISSFADLWEDL